MPSVYKPRRPRASPLWQIVTAAWDAFVSGYEKIHRAAMGPLRPNVFSVVRNFLRCGDLAAGFLRFRCPDCGHERLLAFTCKGRHFCPACHQRRVRQTAEWIASHVCLDVPHRQFVFTRWKHSGFNIDGGGEKPVAPHDASGRKRLAEYLLRSPFSLQKITWNPETQTVIYRSKPHWRTKRNFEIFKAADFLAAVIDHIPPKGQQTVRYYQEDIRAYRPSVAGHQGMDSR